MTRQLSGQGGAAAHNAAELWSNVLPRLSADAHKHLRGHVLVVAGGLEGVGAPRLAARAALRIGAGLVTIGAPQAALAAHAARGPDALMLRQVESAVDLEALAGQARPPTLVIGPALGLDARAAALVATAIGLPSALVLDADALTLIARDRTLHAPLAARRMPAVLTPHEGEFARLAPDLWRDMTAALNDAGEAAQPSARDAARAEAARTLAAKLGAIVVLKGPGTIIAVPDGRSLVNGTGSPALATAGTGDVLAGVIGGLLAQGMPSFEAASAAAFWHGQAGARLGPGLIADDLPDEIGRLRWSMSPAET